MGSRIGFVAVALFLGLVLSGCLDGSGGTSAGARTGHGKAPGGGVATTPTPRALPTSLSTPTPSLPTLLGAGYGEPNIAIAPDGTIYVTPIDHLYRSADGGKTFNDLGTGRTSGHGDGDIAIDSTGRLHWLGLSTGSNSG